MLIFITVLLLQPRVFFALIALACVCVSYSLLAIFFYTLATSLVTWCLKSLVQRFTANSKQKSHKDDDKANDDEGDDQEDSQKKWTTGSGCEVLAEDEADCGCVSEQDNEVYTSSDDEVMEAQRFWELPLDSNVLNAFRNKPLGHARFVKKSL